MAKQVISGSAAPSPLGPMKFPIHVKQKKAELHKVNSTHATRQQLEKEEVDALLNLCRKNQASMTTLVSSVFSEACAKLIKARTGRSTFRVGLSLVVDIRADVSPPVSPHDLSLFAGAGPLISTPRRDWSGGLSLPEVFELARGFKRTVSHQGDRRSMSLLTPWTMEQLPLHDFMPGPTVSLSSWNAKNPIRDEYPMPSGSTLKGGRFGRHARRNGYFSPKRLHLPQRTRAYGAFLYGRRSSVFGGRHRCCLLGCL